MKKAIVTGANGFIGSAVVKYLSGQGIEVLALCHHGHSDKVDNLPLVKVGSLDLEDMQALLEFVPKDEYDIFYHFAWKGSAGVERADTRLQLDNVQWAVEALEVASALGCKRFVGAGSIMEHEAIAETYTQDHKSGLGTIYGGGKLTAHIMCQAIAGKLGMELLWGEITNAYGVGEVSPRMVNTAIRKCIDGEAPQFTAGTQNYDFVYIDDVARAFYLIGAHGKPFREYLIGSSTARPLKEFLLEMKESISPEIDFIFGDVPFTGINLPLSCFDCSVTEKDTGFRAEVSFAEGTRRTMDWLRRMGECY